MFHNLFDSHVHSNNSPDGRHSVIYLAERAEAAGLMGLAVTDHVECLDYEKLHFPTRITQSMVDIAKAEMAFRYHLSIARGIELGVTPGEYQVADQALELHPFDLVLGACHMNRLGEEYYDMDYAGLSEKEMDTLLRDYFEDLLDMCRWGRFDVLAHLTLPLKWAAKNSNRILDSFTYRGQIDEILRRLVDLGKGLELNMSGLRAAIGESMPPMWALKRFRELGGEVVTIGSDAHSTMFIGSGIADGMEMLQEAGFDYFAFYRSREPVMLRIV